MSTATGKVVVNRAMSLDGFIAGPGDEMGWIRDLAPQEDTAKVAAATGAMLVGRRTWDVGDRMEADEPGSTDYPFTGPMFLLTHRPLEGADPGVTILSGDIGEAVATALDAASIAAGDTTRASSTTGSAILIGFWAAILTAVDAALFAAIGIATPARSGPFCATWGCIPAPYTDVAGFIPADYLWLIPGIVLAPIFVVLLASIHAWAPEPQKVFSRIALAFAVAYAVVIGVDYFVQFTVVIPSLQSGETEGLSLFTQYNPHGLFIAGEALGYLAMSVALLSAAPVFAAGRIERTIRWLFVGGFVLAIAAFVGLWLVGGDLVAFEVSVLSINWIVLIASGALLGIVFRRAARATQSFSAGGSR